MQIEHSDFQDQLVRGLTHRMNNILTLFHGYLGLLLEDQKLDPPTLLGLGKIKEGARAASELMDRTHSLARPSTLIWREVNLGEFVRMLKPSFDAFCGPKTEVVLEIPDDLPPAWADASRVKTAVVEVVRNAIEASAAGGVVKIILNAVPAPSGTQAEKPLHWISLTVIDQGPGITPAVGERVFLPFYSTRKKRNATGLGLTVALSFIEQVGGIIRFTSEPGNTRFQLLLPCRSEAI
ncbi:MAG TPA: ATP-binding protein [Chthoniobacteraceae bacterium]|jgi:signal transduction histidine kinase